MNIQNQNKSVGHYKLGKFYIMGVIAFILFISCLIFFAEKKELKRKNDKTYINVFSFI